MGTHSVGLARYPIRPRPLHGARRSTALTVAILLVLQCALGLFVAPQPAMAAETSDTWTDRADFEANASTTGEVTSRVQVDTVTSPGDVKLSGRPVAISGGTYHVLGLRADGSVVAVGGEFFGTAKLNTIRWTDIVAVAGGFNHTAGLKSDGTVITTEPMELMDVSGWSGIKAIAASWSWTVGLKSDGSVVATGTPLYDEVLDVSGWSGVTAVDAGKEHTLGLKADGTVVAVGRNWDGQLEVADWSGITAIAAGGFHSVGLRSDGTVVADGDNSQGQLDVSGWSDIVAIAADGDHTIGVKSDGTVLAVGQNLNGVLNVLDWTDIVAIDTGWVHTIGMKSDGSFVAVGPPEVIGNVPAAFGASAMIGAIGGEQTGVGLRADLGEGGTLTSLVSDFDPLREGEAVKLGVRLSDDGTTWTDIRGTDGGVIDWTDGTGTYFGQSFGDVASRTSLAALPSARYIDIVVLLEGYAGTSPVLHGVTLNASAEPPVTHEVAFNSNGGTAVPSQSVDHGSLASLPIPAPTKVGSTFGGWYADAGLTDAWDFSTDAVTGPITLYAKWVLNTYTVRFLDWNGTELKTQLVNHGSAATAPSSPTRLGHTFTGWSPSTFSNITGDLTVTAQYAPIPTGVEFIRYGGYDRYETAHDAADGFYPEGADTAIIATGLLFPDALAASSLAGITDAPILLTRTATLHPLTRQSLIELGVSKVYIMGSVRAVSSAVELEIRRIPGITSVVRLGGPTRYETALEIAKEVVRLGGSTTEMFLVRGDDFPDALSVSSVAAQKHIPIMLTRPAALDGNAWAHITSARVQKVYVAGSTIAVSKAAADAAKAAGASTVTRWGGANRYETGAAVINGAKATWGISLASFGIATGALFPDALTGGALMGRDQGVLVLTRPDILSATTEALLVANKSTIRKVVFFGSTRAVSATVEARVRAILK